MPLDIYWTSLLVLSPLVLAVAVLQVWRFSRPQSKAEQGEKHHEDGANDFQLTFLPVYLLAMSSEWLQGPYMYSLLRDEKGHDDMTVAGLYIVTYTSAALSSFLAGYLSDKLGRRTACLAYFAIHSLASLSVCFDHLAFLVAGRVFGGMGLTLLWTAFESWMLAEYKFRGLDERSLPLSTMFGTMTTTNCITAILAGVLGHCIVLVFGSKTDPFLLGLALDASAAILMIFKWREHRNATHYERLPECGGEEASQESQVPTPELQTSIADTRLWVLSFVTCCFEGTMFLFLFFWPGMLQEAHGHPAEDGTVPYGVIFATFMAVMVLGAFLFSTIHDPPTSTGGHPRRIATIFTPTRLLAIALLLSGASFLLAVLVGTELELYLVFLVLEACHGIYVPSIAYYRGLIVNENTRARTYGLMNIPLFLFIVVSLLTTRQNEEQHRQPVFFLSAALLLLASVATMTGLNGCCTSKKTTEP